MRVIYSPENVCQINQSLEPLAMLHAVYFVKSIDSKKKKYFILGSNKRKRILQLESPTWVKSQQRSAHVSVVPRSAPKVLKFVDHALIKFTKFTASSSSYFLHGGMPFESFFQGSTT